MLGLRYLPLPNIWSYTSLLIPLALLAWLAHRWLRSRRSRQLVGSPPPKLVLSSGDESGSRGRLLVVGKPPLLAPFVRLGPVLDEPFEPIVVFAPRIAKMPPAGTAVLVITAIAVAVLIEVLRRTTTLPLIRPGWVTIMAGVAVGVGVQILLWPTYLRITPGRLDIMRFTLGSKRPEVSTVNLRGAQVLAHFKHSAICIRPAPLPPNTAPAEAPAPLEPKSPTPSAPPAHDPQWTVLNLRGVWRPAEVVHAVLRGTVSNSPTPPLPDDQLLG